MSQTFSPWCARCLAGDYNRLKYPSGGHQEHKLIVSMKSRLKWKVADEQD